MRLKLGPKAGLRQGRLSGLQEWAGGGAEEGLDERLGQIGAKRTEASERGPGCAEIAERSPSYGLKNDQAIGTRRQANGFIDGLNRVLFIAGDEMGESQRVQIRRAQRAASRKAHGALRMLNGLDAIDPIDPQRHGGEMECRDIARVDIDRSTELSRRGGFVSLESEAEAVCTERSWIH